MSQTLSKVSESTFNLYPNWARDQSFIMWSNQHAPKSKTEQIGRNDRNISKYIDATICSRFLLDLATEYFLWPLKFLSKCVTWQYVQQQPVIKKFYPRWCQGRSINKAGLPVDSRGNTKCHFISKWVVGSSGERTNQLIIYVLRGFIKRLSDTFLVWISLSGTDLGYLIKIFIFDSPRFKQILFRDSHDLESPGQIILCNKAILLWDNYWVTC